MTKIISKTNCGNSPKMEFLKQFNIAFAEGDLEFLTNCVTEDIVWDIIGDQKTQGIIEFREKLTHVKSIRTNELVLEQILSHGKEGAVNGIMKMQNGKHYAFSDFYRFHGAKGTKIKSITSYCIEV